MKKSNDSFRTILGFVTGGVAFALLFVAWVYPEIPTASYALASLLVVLLGALAYLNQKALRAAVQTRSLRYGTNAAITVGLVFAILFVVNFLNHSHFVRKDLTKNKSHSLSEQTIKILKDLKTEVKMTAFVKGADREAIKPMLENYLYQTKRIQVEYVDPIRDPARTTAAGVKKEGTIIVSSGKRDARAEEASEEKLTNAILKTLKDKAVQVCFTTGHGEHPIDGQDQNAYSYVKRELLLQNYESKNISLLEEGKVPADCSLVVVGGPTKPFFDKEVDVLLDYLDKGGRAIFALDPNLKSGENTNKALTEPLAKWTIEVKHNLVLDPMSRMLNVNATVPMVGIYSKDHPITRDAQGVPALFPLTATVDVKPNQVNGLKVWWLAKSTARAFAKSDFKEIATGKVVLNPSKDAAGPHVMMVAIEGGRTEDKKPAHPTRIVVFGTSQMAINQWAQHGANLDLFLNAASWLADDENLISIRPKDEIADIPTLSEEGMSYIKFLLRGTIPGGALLAGILVWRRRKKL